MDRKTLTTAATGAIAALLLAACSTGASDGSAADASISAPGTGVLDTNKTSTVGPNGERPTPVADLTLTTAEIARLQGGNHTAAFLWHTSSAWVSAVQRGAEAEFSRLGIDVVLTADANFDAGTQANQIQTATAKKPDVILSLPVDPTSSGSSYRAAADDGSKLVFVDNAPDGFEQGTDYSSIVTGDLFELGRQAAVAMCESLGGDGKVGMLFYDAKFYVTNQRDAAFKRTLEQDCPGIEIVAQQGFTDPNSAEGIANAMLTQHPDLDGVYTSWAQPAAGVLSALRNTGNANTKVVTLDLDDTVVVDMASGGATSAVVADKAWELGKGLADAAAYAILGKKAPPFAVVGGLTVTADSIVEGYRASLHQDVPGAVREAVQ